MSDQLLIDYVDMRLREISISPLAEMQHPCCKQHMIDELLTLRSIISEKVDIVDESENREAILPVSGN